MANKRQSKLLEKHRTSKSAWLTNDERLTVISLHELGKSQVEIAKIVGCSPATVCTLIKSTQTPPDAVRKLARSYIPQFFQGVVDAIEPAAKRGDSAPALKALALAHLELGAQPAGSHGGVGVSIIIGQPGAPLEPPVITIESQPKPTFALPDGEVS